MPIQPRARSKASLANDARILSAAIAEAHAVGIDRLALRPVGRRCDLTSGALYARYESADELIASMWAERIGQPLLEFLREAMAAMLGREGSPSIAEIAETLSNPPKHIAVGIECLVVGRRNDVLGDEIEDDFSNWTGKVGLDPTNDPTARALNVVAFSAIIGAALYSFVEPRLADWTIILTLLSEGIKQTSTEDSGAAPPIGNEIPDQRVSPATNEPLRDALISATANVIGRTGYENATLSRIARRAKLTGGAVYTRYATKDELIIDTLDTLLSDAIVGTRHLTERGVQSGNLGDAVGMIFSLGVTPDRRSWRQFRLETYVAARTRKEPRAALRRVHVAGLDRYHAMLADRSRIDDGTIRLIARGGQSIPLGLSVVETYLTDLVSLNFHPFSRSLLDILRTVTNSD